MPLLLPVANVKTTKSEPVVKPVEQKANVPVVKPEDKTAIKTVDTEKVKAQVKSASTPAVVRAEQSVKSTPEKEVRSEPAKPVQQKPKSTQTAPVAAKSTSQSTAKPGGRAFVVQVMASTTPLSVNDARFGKQKGKVRQYIAEGAGSYKYKYCVGRYTDRDSAQKAAMSLQSEFKGAFVIEVNGDYVVRK